MKQFLILVRTYRKTFSILAVGFGLVWIFRAQLYIFSDLIVNQEAITDYILQLGVWGPWALFGLLVLQVFAALIPGHVLMIAGGYAYEFWPSFLISLSSTVLGSQIAFLIARRWGRALVHRLASKSVIERWDGLADRQGALFYFFSFVLPIFPSDLMTYVAGLGTISPRRFFVANICGRLVAASVLTLIGARGSNMPIIFWVAILAGMALLFIGWRYYAHKHGIRVIP